MPAKVKCDVGPMFSGKSWAILHAAQESQHAGERVLCVKPIKDLRNDGCIAARGIDKDGNDVVIFSLPAKTIDNPWEIMDHLEKEQPHLLIIDEVHLFEKEFVEEENVDPFKNEIVDVVKALRDNAHTPPLNILIAGLDMDYRREPYRTTAMLMALANNGVTKHYGVCMGCKARGATYTQAIHPMTSNLETGSRDKYQIRCQDCHHIP